MCTNEHRGGPPTGNDYARPEKSLMEIVPLSTNYPEIPRDVTVFKIPPLFFSFKKGIDNTCGLIIRKCECSIVYENFYTFSVQNNVRLSLLIIIIHIRNIFNLIIRDGIFVQNSHLKYKNCA